MNCFIQTTVTHISMTTRHTVSNSELFYSDHCSLRKLVQAVKGHNPQKAHLHPPRDLCVQYENNLGN